MKIVCDACQAKYSISDDKVQGKVFKIRCKKCSNIIVVRGGAGGSAAEPAEPAKDTRVYDYGEGGGGAPADDAVWHLVINQDQVGPMTAAEVQQRFSAGEVDGETFAWREGFADWLPLTQVDAFAGLAASASGGAQKQVGGGHAVASMFGGGDDLGTARSDPGDLFAAASGSARADDGDLFGSKPAPAQAAANAQKMRGERNESSVLFSLNNLAQLASNSPAPVASASSSASHGAAGAAGGEGSGLIDIRSMASAYLGGAGMAAKPATSSAGIGSIDDLPVFGGVGFSEPAVLVPSARASNNNKIVYVLIGAVGLFAVAAVIMVVVLLKSNKSTPAAATTAVAAADKNEDKGSGKGSDTAADTGSGSSAGSANAVGSGSGSSADTGSGSATGSAGSAGSGSAQVAMVTPPPAPSVPTAPVHHDTPRPTTPTHTAPTSPSSPPRPKADTPPPTPKADKTVASTGGDSGGGCDEVSCVLNNYEGACCAKFKKGGNKAPSGGNAASSSSGSSNLPASLDRDTIQAGISGVKPKANACGSNSSAKGQVLVHVKVGADGHVSDVSVEKTPDPALSACVAAAIKKASFAKTQSGGSFRIPFSF